MRQVLFCWPFDSCVDRSLVPVPIPVPVPMRPHDAHVPGIIHAIGNSSNRDPCVCACAWVKYWDEFVRANLTAEVESDQGTDTFDLIKTYIPQLKKAENKYLLLWGSSDRVCGAVHFVAHRCLI